MSWSNMFWSHHVHRYLTETLHYYFLRVRPFDARRIVEGMESLAKQHNIGSVRCYPVFGRYDLLVRVWLHPAVAVNMTQWLDDALPDIRRRRQFTVEEIMHVWYDSEKEPVGRDATDLLRELNDHVIQGIQGGKEDALLARLRESNLALEEMPDGAGIKFFITIRLTDFYADRKAAIAADLANYCSTQPGLYQAASYYGVGDDCSVLVKAKAENYFLIADVPLYINKNYDGVTTETFLCLERNQLFGDGRIGRATFEELQGRSMVVQGIIPEAYKVNPDEHSSNRVARSRNIVKMIDSRIGVKRKLTPGERQLVREYLLGYLNDDETAMAKVIFEAFISLERFLRENAKVFVGKTMSGGFDAAFSAVGATSPIERKRMSLGKLFELYKHCFGANGTKLEIFSTFGELVSLRNETLHGDLELSGDRRWDPIDQWLNNYQLLQELISRIRAETDGEFRGRFF